jgi:hypothetical protein
MQSATVLLNRPFEAPFLMGLQIRTIDRTAALMGVGYSEGQNEETALYGLRNLSVRRRAGSAWTGSPHRTGHIYQPFGCRGS